VTININYRYVEDELRYIMNDADLTAMIHQRELTPLIAAAKASAPRVRTLLYVEDSSGIDAGTTGSIAYESAIEGSPEHADFPERSGADLYIVYTGGTTGMPRGVMWRHEDLFFAGLQGGNPGGDPIGRPEELADIARRGDKAMAILPAAPLIHGAAQWAAFIGLFSGGKVVLSESRSFHPEQIWTLVEREGVSVMNVVGDAMAAPLVEALESASARPDTSSLIVISSAGAVLSPAVRDRLQALLPDAMILNSFGASETGHQGTVIDGMGGPSRRPAFYMDETNTVFDADFRPIEPGSGLIGRLARAGRIPLGYYNAKEATAARFVEVGGKRWVLPGDMATIEADGTITVFGRDAVCINSGGEKVFTEEVEEAVKSHPKVADAIIVGVPDARFGERVAAVVQVRSGETLALAELDAHCRTKIAGYKVPRELCLVDQVRRQPSGKPDYRWAKAAALEKRGS
jgi:acyl-CoA synthetase (AMP-forming)/AMP-acid ligase II